MGFCKIDTFCHTVGICEDNKLTVVGYAFFLRRGMGIYILQKYIEIETVKQNVGSRLN